MVVRLHAVPFEHAELGVMMGPQLFGITEAAGNLKDVSASGRNEFFHMNLRRRNEVQREGSILIAGKNRLKEFYRRFRNKCRCKQGCIHFQVVEIMKKVSNPVDNPRTGVHLGEIHGTSVKESLYLLH